MKSLWMAAALGLAALTGCAGGGERPASASQVQVPTLNDTAGRAVELAYMAARTAVEVGVDAGKIKGAEAARFQSLNRKAFAAVRVARAAFSAPGATVAGTKVEADAADKAIGELLALAAGRGQ